jgi:acyl-CoA thioesterase FadM
MDRKKLWFAAAEATCKYYAFAKFQDLLDLKASIKKIGRTSIIFAHEIRRAKDRRVLAEGHIVDVLLDEKKRPAAIPEDVREKLRRYLA